ncbi:antitoxin VbhA family protein, partial [Pseudomonas simiae]
RASVGLEAFELSKVDEEHARAYVEGEITLDEFIERASAALDE